MVSPIAAGVWLAAAAFILLVPDVQDVDRTELLGGLAAALGGAQLVAWLGGRVLPPLTRVGYWAPWLLVLGVWIAGWEAVAAKLDLLPLPFFASPQAFIEVYTDDWQRLGDSLLHSLLLLGRGYIIGAAAGFVCGRRWAGRGGSATGRTRFCG